MAEFTPYTKGITLNGQTIHSITSTDMLKDKALKYLAAVGLSNVVPDDKHWYSLDKFLEAFKMMADEINTYALFMVGQRVLDSVVLPPIKNIEEALGLLNISYHMNHKDPNGKIMFNPETNVMLGGIGNYKAEKIKGENKIRMVVDVPYPCRFDRGLINTFARRYNKTAYIKEDLNEPCRAKGADSCTYIITWK